jgi:hypothetical protein
LTPLKFTQLIIQIADPTLQQNMYQLLSVAGK